MSAKTEREKIIRSGDPIAKHSLNQRHMVYMKDGKEKFFIRDKKAARARQKRELLEDQERGMELLGERREFQFDRALGNTFNGGSLEDVIDLAPENILYFVKHIDGHEREIETYYNTEKGTEVSITIVEFTRPNSNNSA